jgi:hypothetical protein
VDNPARRVAPPSPNLGRETGQHISVETMGSLTSAWTTPPCPPQTWGGKSSLGDEVAHFVAFGFDVFFAVFGGGGDDGDGFGDFESESLEAGAFGGVVGDELHLADAEVVEHLGAEAVVALVGFES